jgi:predicted permease
MQEVLIKAVCYIGIIFMGFTLRKRGFFGENAFGVITSIVMKITLPAAIISGSSGKTIPLAMLSIMGLSLGSGILYMLISARMF